VSDIVSIDMGSDTREVNVGTQRKKRAGGAKKKEVVL
jgi:hypothetical protein